MTTGDDCPDVQRLRELLLGRIPRSEAELLEGHLSTCDSCARTVSTLQAEDHLVRAVRSARHIPAEEPDTVLQNLIGRLKGLHSTASIPGQQTTTFKPSPRDQSAPDTIRPQMRLDGSQTTAEDFDFLMPPEGPGEIGRLGSYRVLQFLGAGGMGIVFQAEDPQLQRLVALKVMKPALTMKEENRQRFLREAQLTALIEHDHIVAIHQVGEDRGVLFLAMQMLRGETLEERVRRLGKLPVLEVLRIGRELARGLAAAHERGLIHRDIKPANIWLEADTDRIKILDFGLALAGQDTQNKERGAIVGTPAFMAPEQARGELAGPACDLFSLGAVLYRLSTGEMPFRGPDTLSILMALALDQPAPPKEVHPDVPAVLSDLIMRLLEKMPANRPSSATEVETALVAIEQDLTAPPPPRRLRRMLAALGVLTVLGVAAFWLGSRFFRPAPLPEQRTPTEGELVVEFDDADLPFILQTGDAAQQIRDLKAPQTLTLAPGDYTLRLAEPRDGLQLVTDKVTIVRGEKKTVTIRRIGQLQRLDKLGAVIQAVAFAPDGERALAAADRFVLLLDLTTGAELASWKGHRSLVQCVAFSADGRVALSGSGSRSPKPDFSVRLWDVPMGMEIRTLTGHTSWVTGVALSADGKRGLSGSYDKTAIVWDMESGRIQRVLLGCDAGINAVALSGDGRWALTGDSEGSVRLWDADTGEELRHLEGHAESVRGVALSPDGRFALSGSYDQTLRLWDLESGEEVQRFAGHEGWVNSVAFSPDGRRVLSGGADRTVRLWDAATGQEVSSFREHTAAVQSVAFASDGRRAVSGGLDRTVRLWQLP